MSYTLCCLNFSHFSMHHSHSTGYRHLMSECGLRYDFKCENIFINLTLGILYNAFGISTNTRPPCNFLLQYVGL